MLLRRIYYISVTYAEKSDVWFVVVWARCILAAAIYMGIYTVLETVCYGVAVGSVLVQSCTILYNTSRQFHRALLYTMASALVLL
jgi:hypothetical protein